MENNRRPTSLTTLTSLVGAALVIAALYFGKDVLVPFALALLLSFLLAPTVTALEGLRLGRPAAATVVLALAVAGISAILWLGTTQLTEIVSNLPLYQTNISKKIEAMRNPAGYGLTKVITSVQELSKTLEPPKAPVEHVSVKPATKLKGHATPAQAAAPVSVEVRSAPPGLLDSIRSVGGPLLRFIEQAAGVLIFTLFMLVKRGDLRDRLFRLFGQRHLNVMTTAMDDAACRVSRYLLTQTIVNAAFGLVLGSGLFLLGVPDAPFWGMLGAILRFVPYVGSLIAGLCPLVLALAVFEGWTKPLLTLGLFASVELLISTAVEPWLYGAHTGVSSLAILVSSAFWTLLWGPIGLVLSTPLTVCLVVLGRYAPPLEFLSLLLSDESALSPAASYYQRLLAQDEEDAENVAETYLKDRSVAELYDSVLIPALSMAERDRHRDNLDIKREDFIYRTTRNLIETIAEHNQLTDVYAGAEAAQRSPGSILCVPARDQADELAALMLCQLLRSAQMPARCLEIGTVESMLDSIEQQRPDTIFVSSLPPFGILQTRALCRKIRDRYPDLQIMVGFWSSASELEKIEARLGSNCFDQLVTTLGHAQAVLRIRADAPRHSPKLQVSAPASR